VGQSGRRVPNSLSLGVCPKDIPGGQKEREGVLQGEKKKKDKSVGGGRSTEQIPKGVSGLRRKKKEPKTERGRGQKTGMLPLERRRLLKSPRAGNQEGGRSCFGCLRKKVIEERAPRNDPRITPYAWKTYKTKARRYEKGGDLTSHTSRGRETDEGKKTSPTTTKGSYEKSLHGMEPTAKKKRTGWPAECITLKKMGTAFSVGGGGEKE